MIASPVLDRSDFAENLGTVMPSLGSCRLRDLEIRGVLGRNVMATSPPIAEFNSAIIFKNNRKRFS
jgi:hypothetical protein